MDKYKVLAKFFGVSEKFRNERKKRIDDRSDEALNNRLANLPHSGRRIMCILLEVGQINQRTIAKEMNISAQAVSEIIKKLESLDLIDRKSGNLNNEMFISLKPEGVELAKVLDKRIKDHANKIFENFTDEELDQLYNLLDKL